MGEPANIFFPDEEILSDTITSYYTDYEPESIFIAEYSGNIVGYLTGCKDTRRYYRIWRRKILPKIIKKALYRGALFNIKIIRFLFHSLIGWIKGDFKRPNIYKNYPAHFHINIVNGYRDLGIGTILLEYFLEYLRKENIRSVYAVTISEKAKAFFRKNGFESIYSHKINLFNYLLKKDIRLDILARVL